MDIEKVVDTLKCENDLMLLDSWTGETNSYELLTGFNKDCYDAHEFCIKALNELQKYRQIGPADEIKDKIAELERWHTTKINEKIRNPFANTSTLICQNCDHKDEYIEELESRIGEYEKIGTVDECREVREKQIAKTPDYEGDGCDDSGDLIYDTWICPKCEEHYEVGFDNQDYCPKCGQHIHHEEWENE